MRSQHWDAHSFHVNTTRPYPCQYNEYYTNIAPSSFLNWKKRSRKGGNFWRNLHISKVSVRITAGFFSPSLKFPCMSRQNTLKRAGHRGCLWSQGREKWQFRFWTDWTARWKYLSLLTNEVESWEATVLLTEVKENMKIKYSICSGVGSRELSKEEQRSSQPEFQHRLWMCLFALGNYSSSAAIFLPSVKWWR